MAERTYELAALNRALEALNEADESGDLDNAAEWRDELDVIALYTSSKGISARCRAAINASHKRAAGRIQ
nr:hypothetical protein [uncultured Rhizobium sp.]